MKNKIVLAAALSLATQCGLARESWPVAEGADRQRQQEFKKHEENVKSKIAPELAEWAKKGKPFIPWAAKPEDLPQAKVPAFPGAEGAGKFSFGGRGGKVYVVTSLADSGPGTFRQACEAAGPRIVVFNVAGIIHLKEPVNIEAPYITIDGHTAPGDGVCIAGESTLVDTHDVVIRYLRFRRGNTDVYDRDDSLGGNPIGNIIVDHCSCSWGLDENLSMYRHIYERGTNGFGEKLPTVNITLQWNISSEALNTYNHAFGATWGGRNSSFHHNLFACNTGRNPSIGMSYGFNFMNNVLFNWRHRTVDGGDRNSLYNIINNYYKPGPVVNSGTIQYRVLLPSASKTKEDPTPRFGKAYVAGNIVEGNAKVSADNWEGGVQFADGGSKDDPTTTTNEKVKALVAEVRVDKPFPMAAVSITSAQQAYEDVLKFAGASLPRRDAVDERVINEVKTGKVWSQGKEFTPTPMKGLARNNWGTAGNGIITDISQVGGYPEYHGEPIKDLCPDGIPLSWKKTYGLDTKDASLAQKDLQGDGYTVMDKYLAGLDPTKKIDWNNPKSNVNTLE
ncbi:MAG TPA: polysaccharide lyase [Candidatus Angelobacter sp.]|nr:polysaccharide lyase [Candidatus Angelobacter sp.]